LAGDGEAFVRGEGDLVVGVRAAAVVDAAVGGFDHSVGWMDDEAVAGFGAGHDVDVNCSRGGGIGDGRSGVAVVHPYVGVGGGNACGLGKQCEEACPVRHIGRGQDSGD
jgi:hypothetical protein